MTTDPFAEAARAEAHRYHWELREGGGLYYPPLDFGQHMAEWARDHLAAHSDLTVESEAVTVESDEPTDAEVLAALNAQGVVTSPKMHPAPSLDYWGDKPVEAMRTALSAARAVRRDEENQ